MKPLREKRRGLYSVGCRSSKPTLHVEIPPLLFKRRLQNSSLGKSIHGDWRQYAVNTIYRVCSHHHHTLWRHIDFVDGVCEMEFLWKKGVGLKLSVAPRLLLGLSIIIAGMKTPDYLPGVLSMISHLFGR